MRVFNARLGLSVVSLAFAGAVFVAPGCATDPADDVDEEAPSGDALVGESRSAITFGWTAYTSEEYPPIGCDNGSGITDFQCTGRYCDNFRAYCSPTGGSGGSSYWTGYFSEEGTNNAVCSAGSWVTGMSCRGRYCDDVALQCTSMGGISEKNCIWTGWVSEENGGTLNFGSGYFMRGARCSGSYCDNMSFLVCQR